MPSITGAVVFVEMTKPVTSTLTDSEIAELVSMAEDSFGVYPGTVEAELTYDITGSVTFETDGELDEEELISALQQSIADTLSVHPSDVTVVIDPESGVATYTIASENVEDAMILQDALQEATTNEAISNAISETVPALRNVTMTFIHFDVHHMKLKRNASIVRKPSTLDQSNIS